MTAGERVITAGMQAAQDLVREVVTRLNTEMPHFSARKVFTERQVLVIYALLSALLALLAAYPQIVAVVMVGLLAVFHTAGFAFKAWLAFCGEISPHRQEARVMSSAFPTYSVLVPLYRESTVLSALLHALQSLDYPAGKLEIFLVLEEDDFTTRQTLRRHNLPAHFRIVDVPAFGPRTKPKALCYALAYAKGTLCVVYDAEDQPEPDQLLRAARQFRTEPPSVACLQARLNYYNARENWLTRLFAIDYCLWFDYLLPGLERLRAPIPLGGTSNHFRTAALLAAGAWDPFNVTEDADLGLRLARFGLQVRTLDSTTYEEAPRHVSTWLKQRTRWLKGYMQTYLVHMREPVRLAKETGWTGLATCHLFLLATIVAGLLNPVLWIVFVVWISTDHGLFSGNAGIILLALSSASLLLGNALIVYLSLIAPLRRGWLDLVPWALASPLYWLLISVAAWLALAQLLSAPFLWVKTPHGLTRFLPAARLSESARP